MIVSHKYQYIFWKPRSVAGSTLLHALGRHAGLLDHVTCPAELKEGTNFERNIVIRHLSNGNEVVDTAMQKTIRTHIRPRKIRRLVGDDIWRAYVKLTVIRNPWDKVVSIYCRRLQRGCPRARKGFEFFTQNHPIGDEDFWFSNGELLPDRIIRFENLQLDFDAFCQDLGIPVEPLPFLKGEYRPKDAKKKPKQHYSSYYTDISRQVVADTYSQAIEQFGYKFVNPDKPNEND
jgi:hypothetical protein